MTYTHIETEGIVVETAKAEFIMKPIVLDEIRVNEVLIEMMYTGICHTDIIMQQGHMAMTEYPAIFGHEGAGIIRALGSDVSDKSLEVGDYVVLSTTMCGTCRSCVGGRGDSCRTQPNVNFTAVRISDGSTPARLKDGTPVRSQFFGQSSLSRMSVVHDQCVIKCPYPESLAYYAPLGCGFQTGAGTILNRLKPGRNSRVAIFGMGSVGLAALMAAAYLRVEQLIAVDIMDQKLSLATELGATHTLNSRSQRDIISSIRDITDGGADFVIDCTGAPSVVRSIIDCLGVGGCAVSIGIPPTDTTIQIDCLQFLFDNKSYAGVTGGGAPSKEFIPKLMELHQQGVFPIDKICRFYPVVEFKQALTDLHSGSVLKPIICWK